MFTNTYLSLTCLIIKHKVELKLSLITIKTKINKHFLKPRLLVRRRSTPHGPLIGSGATHWSLLDPISKWPNRPHSRAPIPPGSFWSSPKPKPKRTSLLTSKNEVPILPVGAGAVRHHELRPVDNGVRLLRPRHRGASIPASPLLPPSLPRQPSLPRHLGPPLPPRK